MKKIKKIAVFLYQELNGLPLIIKCIWKKNVISTKYYSFKRFFYFQQVENCEFQLGR